ncbi:hypothetical protein C900_02339 [Fulvivirga imtechensis AK7]|uniref:Uncharacterized protein n=1 Tax=Fulvivirga imtechensis AK7 TaxID=1237149 RepID=L8JVY5_9BACT|nr:hypothetical protein [Fulvivirga imtechensis]ELR71754.1 hypothetical protein C900_02339 [Fulvivirga imtechensis AK7]
MKKTQNRKRNRQPSEKRKKQRKAIVYGLGIGALLGGGYLAYTFIRNKAATGRGDVIINHLPAINQVKQVVEQNKSNFPLTTGAKGTLVKMLQSALLAMGGEAAEAIKATSIKPNGEPDGIFGSGTVKALLAAGLPAMVSESTFTQLIAKNKSQGSLDSKAIADGIKAGAEKQNIFTVLNELAKIKDVAGYREVSSHFNGARIRGTKVTTLVNALLSVAFASNEAAKVKIRAEFSRMGLVNRNGVWSLSGFGMPANYSRELFKLAVTRKPTLLKEGDGRFLPPVVKSKKVVGYVTGGKSGVVQVYTPQGQIVYAPEKNLTLI